MASEMAYSALCLFRQKYRKGVRMKIKAARKTTLIVDVNESRHALDTFNNNGVEVEMSNSLVRAADRLNLTSKRLVWACIAEANKRIQWVSGQALIVRLSAIDYMETFGVDPSNAYRELRQCAKDLEEEKIIFRRQSKRGKGIEEVHMRWVGRATYNEGEGWVEVAFWHEVVPHLIRLKTDYTQIKLQQASALRSRYSWDLLRLFSQFKSTGRLSIDLDEFLTPAKVVRWMEVGNKQHDLKAGQVSVLQYVQFQQSRANEVGW
jgi:hypothetical protein